MSALLLATLATWLAARPAPAARNELRHCALPAQAGDAPHPGMVWVPAGSFETGDTVYAEEQPRRAARVDGFWMDRTEVSNGEFARFVAATGHVTTAEREVDGATHPGLPPELRRPGAVVFLSPASVQGREDVSQWWRYVAGANWRHPGGPGTDIKGRDNFPVVAISHADAQAYARWKGRRLPTEAQWEWAARGARAAPMPAHEQPREANTWQGPFPVLNSGEDGFIGLAPVGCYAPNALGLYDLIGNVWELTADVYTPAAGQARQRVIKGGSFLCAPNYCMRYRAGARQPQDEDLAASHLGFRTILLAPGP